MKIRVKTYASLGSTDKQIDVEKDISLGELLDKLNIPEKEVFIILINGIRSDPDSNLKDGDSVSIFPFIGGG